MTRPLNANQAPADLTEVSAGVSASEDKNKTPGCCSGTNVPGVGYVHAGDCFWSRSLRADAKLNADVQSALDLQTQREEQLSRLIFAARDLATGRIVRRLGEVEREGCLECDMWQLGASPLVHGRTCRTGRVLGIIDEMLQTKTKKEAVVDGDAACGDGMRQHVDGVDGGAK